MADEENSTGFPEQTTPVGLEKMSISTGITEFVLTDRVVDVAHWPEDGVKLYVAVPDVAVLIVAGFHVPVIPLIEVAGNASGVSPSQYGPSWVNDGIILPGFTVILIVVFIAHWLGPAVKV